MISKEHKLVSELPIFVVFTSLSDIETWLLEVFALSFTE